MDSATGSSFDGFGSGPTSQDFARVGQAFVGLANAFDYNDSQTYVGQDSDVSNPAGQFLIWTPGVAWANQGTTASSANVRTAQPAAVTRVQIPVSWLLIGAIIFIAARH